MVRLVIVHTAEGARTYEDLGAFFASGSAGVSSHVGIDDTPGRIGEYVKRPNKAWTAGDANPYSVNVELCGFASWTPKEWEKHPAMLDNTGPLDPRRVRLLEHPDKETVRRPGY